MENFNRNNNDIFGMEVDDHARVTFLEMARWTKFLAILGFIFLGLMVLAGLVIGIFIGSNPALSGQFGPLGAIGGIGIVLLYVLIASIMFYPAYALFKYSTVIKNALSTNNKQQFNEAVNHLKNVFRFYGIFTIIMLGLYGVAMIFGAFGALGR